MRRWTYGTALAMVLVACGGGTIGTTIVASSPGSLGTGPQRVLLLIGDEEGELVGGPETEAVATFSHEGEEHGPAGTEWVWGIEGTRGFYTATFDFPEAGAWEVSLSTEDGVATTTPFTVSEEPAVPEVGDPAPPSPTRTTETHELSEITTDPDPDPGFYDLSVEEAVGSGRPSVIVFATPAFCQTAVCGPVLDRIKDLAPGHPDAEFVHVEVFENIDSSQGQLTEVPAVRDWGLLTEPWVFVVDGDGRVAARFEGTVGDEELEQALDAVGA
jgi:hypothetical protein